MKKLFLITLFLFSASLIFGQESIDQLVLDQQNLQQNAMLVLGGWGAANAITGGIGMTTSTGTMRHFHQMNFGWGVINAGIAAFGFYGAMNLELSDPINISLLNENYKLSKALLFNAGLDLGYIATGFYLRERSKLASNHDRMLGFGNSLILQGAFLFGFDVTVHFLNAKVANAIHANIIEFGVTPGGVGMLLNF